MKRFMKLLFAFAFLAGVVIPAQGQIMTRAAKDSTSNSATKYVTFPSTPTGTTGIFLTGLKVSGTVSGYAILQVRTDTLPTSGTTVWNDYVYPGTTKRDTLFFTDVSTVQPYTWPVTTHFFNGARFKVVTSGTQKIYLYAGYLRR